MSEEIPTRVEGERSRAAEARARDGRRVDVLSDIARLLFASSDPAAAIERIGGWVEAAFGLDICLYFASDCDAERLSLRAYHGVTAAAAEKVRAPEFGQIISGTVARERQCRVIADVQHSDSPVTAFIREQGVTAYACFPLVANGHLLGTLSFGTRGTAKISPDVVAALGATADMVATAEARKRAEHALAEHARALESEVAERTAHLQSTVEELETLSYSLAHDLRAPLRTIESFAQIVLDDASERLRPEEKQLLERTINAAERMDRLIQDVLMYARVSRQTIVPKVVPIEPLLRQVIAERPALQSPHATIEIQGPLEPVWGHEACLTQCITNLLENAVKFVAPGVSPRVRIWGETVGHEVRVWFEDNGIGIPPEIHDRVFRMFERGHTQSAYPGTGMGLAIVKRAAERIGGRVGFESVVNQGSRFWLQMPRAEQACE